ncbi:MAG TPA: kinase [Brevundimonas sp.]|nr:kinase [Brevundimonas sp.]
MGRADPRLVELMGRLIAAGPSTGVGPPVIAVVGAQGSGKTTLARAAAETFGGVQISIDDVYLTRARREQMAEEVHPLFLTRGPPGTHDLRMLARLIKALGAARPDDKTLLPDFDKRADDRRPIRDWRVFEGRPRAILIDAWCLGALPEGAADLAEPVNALERDEDPDGAWRGAVNDFVGGSYAAFAARFDAILFLKAPGFDVVLDWRSQQEADLLGVAPPDLPRAERERLAGFIQYFERITRHMLAGGARADVVVELDRERRPGSIPP